MKEFIKKFTPPIFLNLYHFILAFLGAIIYQFPSRKMKVIGVTGTNGKTTTIEMISKILEEAGYKVALMDSIRFKIGNEEELNRLKMTMPGRMKIQRFLRKAANSACQYALLEVTSEGIKQYRHKFIDFDIAVFTNLAPEHIEAHGSFEKYREAKGELFQSLKSEIRNPKSETSPKFQILKSKVKKVTVVNLDDENAEYFLRFPADEKWLYSTNKQLELEELKIDWKLKIENWKLIKATDIKISENRIKFRVNNTIFNLNLLGGFNVYNALAAISLSLSQGINLETCKAALEKIEGIPGRMEEVVSEPFKVFVDYAFTPNALQKVYDTLSGNPRQIPNSKFQKPKLICVLGACGGGRDKWKRPVLGRIAAKYCDETIITNEDPYDENPLEIMNEIERGFSQIQNSKFKIQNYEKILDRRKAINKALTLAKPGDTVIITGKGSEPWICVAEGKKIPWDDREVVKEEFYKITATQIYK